MVTGVRANFAARVSQGGFYSAYARRMRCSRDLSHDFEPGDMYSSICIRGKHFYRSRTTQKRHTTQAPPSGGPKPVLTPSATLSSWFDPVGRSDTRRAVSDGILPSKKGIRVACHRWLSTVNVCWHFEPSPSVVHVSGSKIYHMVLTCVRIVYAKSLQIKR